MSRIAELNDQLEAVRNQKAYLIRHGAENTDQGIVDLEEREADIFRMISEEESRVANEEIATEVRESDQPLILEVDGQAVNFREWITEETNYQVIAIAVKQKIYELNAYAKGQYELLNQQREQERVQFTNQITNADAAADAKYNDLSEKHEELNFETAKLNAELALLRTQNHDLRNERDDYERKLQSAVNEIDSLKQQLEVANSRVEVKAPTNLDGNLAEAMRKANEAKRAIYDVQNDSANINYTAKFVDNDETFTDKVIYIGKYRQMSNEEARRFQQEAEQAKQTELESTPEAEITPEPVEEQFRPDLPFPELSNVDATDGLDENVTEREDGQNGEGGAVTREEFEELKKRVNALTNLSEVVVSDIEHLKAVA